LKALRKKKKKEALAALNTPEKTVDSQVRFHRGKAAAAIVALLKISFNLVIWGYILDSEFNKSYHCEFIAIFIF